MKKFGNGGGIVQTDQGGELARSSEFKTVLESEFGYIVEPSADSPSQNGGSEIYNDKLAVKTRTLLYQSHLPPKFWSSALIHSVYLHNRLVHSVTKTTPYQAWYGKPPDLRQPESVWVKGMCEATRTKALQIGSSRLLWDIPRIYCY